VPIFVSTDYVYDGTRGMRVEDEHTEYGRQKTAVERVFGGDAAGFDEASWRAFVRC
jgi:dTDP-4-dehydrorhamnose reductase